MTGKPLKDQKVIIDFTDVKYYESFDEWYRDQIRSVLLEVLEQRPLTFKQRLIQKTQKLLGGVFSLK